MGLLDRYRKKGGFRQLLYLIETSSTTQQKKFMEIVKKEQPQWAAAITKKMLTVELVFSWPVDVIREFSSEIPLRILAIALKKVGPKGLEKVSATLPYLKKREIEELFNSIEPTPGEIHTASAKVIEKIRQLIENGKIRLERFAPELIIDEKCA